MKPAQIIRNGMIIRNSMLATAIGFAALVSGTTFADDAQKFGRGSVYALGKSVGAPKPFDGVAVAGNGRASVYASDVRITGQINIASRARTLVGNGRASVYVRTSGGSRG